MLLSVASVTSANQIKRFLAHEGKKSSVIQTPSALTKEGCGFSVRFNDADKDLITGFSEKNNITIRAFFKENVSDGKKIYEKVL